MRTRLDTGATVDYMSPLEHVAGLIAFKRTFWLEHARGIKHIRLPALQGYPSGGAVTVGNSGIRLGPNPGFAWSVQRLVIDGLNPADVASFYFNGDQGVPVWQVSGAQFGQTFGKLELTMYGGDFLVAQATTAVTGPVQVAGEAIEVPQEMLWKLA